MRLIFSDNIKKSIPLCFTNDEEILFSTNNKLFIYNTSSKTKKFILSLKINFVKRQLAKNSLIFRLLRLGVRYAIPVYKNVILVVFDNQFFEIDIEKKLLKKTFEIPRGNRPLNITEIKDIEGFENSLYFGEYFQNFKKSSVHIYKRNLDGSWDIVWTFPQDTIEHVHNIIPDKYNQCVWILVGDFNKAAGIWRAVNNFESVEPVVFGSQMYRACVAFPTKEGLIYATDSQFEKNSIRLLKKNTHGWVSEYLTEINGPAIYGCKVKDNYYFSTSVEGDSLAKGKLMMFLDKKPGPGVLDNNSVIIGGNLQKGFHNLYKNEKDMYPFILFQFGAITFPCGINNTDQLFTYNIALKSNDLSTSIYNIK